MGFVVKYIVFTAAALTAAAGLAPAQVPEPPVVLHGRIAGVQNPAAAALEFQFDSVLQGVADVNVPARLESTELGLEFYAEAPVRTGAAEVVAGALAFGQSYFVRAVLNGAVVPHPELRDPRPAQPAEILGPLALDAGGGAAGNPPVIVSIVPGGAQLAPGESIVITVTAEDPDGDPLTIAGSPAGAVARRSHNQVGNRAEAVFEFIAAESRQGQNRLEFAVSDGSNIVTETILITVGSGGGPAGPVALYEFGRPSLAENGWLELPGGFESRPPGFYGFQSFTGDPFPTSADNAGLAVDVRPGEVVFLYAREPIATTRPVLTRMTARAAGGDAQVYLAALRGNLAAFSGVDGSLALNTRAGGSAIAMSQGETVFAAIHEPGETGMVVPVIQVAGAQQAGSVLIDRLEAWVLDAPLDGALYAKTAMPAGSAPEGAAGVPAPAAGYEFGEPTLEGNGWAELPGGFTGAPAGFTAVQGFIGGTFADSADNAGLSINVRPGEVTFLYAREPVPSNGYPLLFRMRTRATGAGAQIYLVGLQGNLGTGANVDGTLGYQTPATSAEFVAGERDVVLVYEPAGDVPVTPVIQVAGGAGASTVYIDRLDVYELRPGNAYAPEWMSSDPD